MRSLMQNALAGAPLTVIEIFPPVGVINYFLPRRIAQVFKSGDELVPQLLVFRSRLNRTLGFSSFEIDRNDLLAATEA